MQLTLQIDKMQNIYDLLALCSSYIFNEIKEVPYDFTTFNDELYTNVYDGIVKYSMDKENIGEWGAFLEFKDFVRYFMGGNSTVEKCYAIVKYIDEKIDYEFRYGIVNRKDILEYKGLNEQCTDKVRILLKNVNSYINKGNVAYIKETKDKYNLLRTSHDCPCSKLDVLYRLKESHYINKHFEGRNKLVFAIIPFTDENIKDILDEKRINHAFYIENMKQDAEMILKERYISI